MSQSFCCSESDIFEVQEMKDDQIETESIQSDQSDNESTGSQQECDQNDSDFIVVKSKTKLKTRLIEFPVIKQLKKPLGYTLAIPQDYKFENLKYYQETMVKLERENYFRKFRQSFLKDIINKDSYADEQLAQSIHEDYQLISNYQVRDSYFQMRGLILEVDICMRIPRYQKKQYEIINNQLMIFVNKNTKHISLGKSWVEIQEDTQVENSNEYLDDENDDNEEEDRVQNDFEIIDFVQSFKIKMNVKNDLKEFFLNINNIASSYFLICPQQYWQALELNLNCQNEFKKLEKIAFPDQTLGGEKGISTFPKYQFLQDSDDATLNKFKDAVDKKVIQAKELDEYQKIALRHALFNQNALIQGPPGTGKTFLACKIVSVLKELYSKKAGKPIIVLSKKNLSLDQLLLRIKDKNPNMRMLRIGKRSTNPEINKFSLDKLSGNQKIGKQKQNNFDIKYSDINREFQKYTTMLEERTQSIGSDLQHELTDKLSKEIKSRLINLLRKAVEIPQQQKISSKIEDKIFNDWLNGKITEVKQLHSILKQTAINLSDEQKQLLEMQIGIQQSSSDFDLEVSEFSILQYLKSLTSFEQFTLGFRKFLLKNNFDLVIQNLLHSMREYDDSQNIYKAKSQKDYQHELSQFMENFDVIGMTFSGYHMHFQAIQQLKAEIVVVEEASEIVEGEFFTVLTPSLKHLIQIGDHQQLRPIIQSNTLQNKYNYKMSYFERLITVNQIEIITLYQQRRMVPQFANFTRMFYGKSYIDEISTKKREFIKRISKNGMYMLQHSYPEQMMNNCSFFNLFEALYIKYLITVLIKENNIEQKKITILTMYKSQKILIESKICGKKGFNEVEVSTIDSFQGNENDIIILSCVRSNIDFKCGFVLNDHRINVAFSRAKVGFFCIGNFEMFAQQSNTWQQIIKLSKQQFSYGNQPESFYRNIYEKTANDLEFEQRNNYFEENICNFCNEKSHLGTCSSQEHYQLNQRAIQFYNEQEISIQEVFNIQTESLQNIQRQSSINNHLNLQFQNQYIQDENGQCEFNQWSQNGQRNLQIQKQNQNYEWIMENLFINQKKKQKNQQKMKRRM